MLRIWGVVFFMATAGICAAAEAPAMDSLRARIKVERGREQELQLLQLEVDRLKLEVEKKKAMAELGNIPGAGADAGSSAASSAQPVLALRGVFLSGGRKEAVVDVDGAQRRVQEGAEVGGRVVKGISAEGVALRAKDGSEVLLQPGD